MHKISKAIAMMGLLAPLGVSALGVGDIRMHSGLNQSLSAEIPLALSGADSLNDVKVSLAGPEAFAKAGVERHYFLTKLQFSAVQKPDGQYAIQVTSREAMREPFLSFLVEVNWPQGRVLREFTVLLDPPASMPEETYAETAPPEVERPYRPYPRRERVAEISHADAAPPMPVRKPARRTISVAPEPAAPVAPPAPAVPRPGPDQLTGDAYGPVRRGETLWSIAQALAAGAGVAPEQMVAGLYRANPGSFSGSANSLRTGTTLQIPTSEYLAQIAPRRGWRTARPAGGRSPDTLVSNSADTPQNQLKLAAPPEAKGDGAGAPAGTAGKARNDVALEVAETVKQENEEFRSRLLQLEQKLSEMQHQLTLKNEEIATLQAQKHGAMPPGPPPTPASKPPAQPAQPVPTPPATPVQPPVAVQPPPAVPVTPQQPPAQAPAAVKPPETPTPPPVIPPPPAQQKPVVPRPPVAAPPPIAEEPGLPIDSTYLIAGGGLALLGFGAWLIKRRRNAMIAETESILLAAERENIQPSSRVMAPKAAESMLEPVIATKSSFLSEFTPSDFDALGTEADDVDPVSEADVYLAYGRYKQAEELIRHAISQHPERDECKLKLLEIYYATENRSAFENYARELKAAKKDAQPDFWAKVVEMGQEIVPTSSLFQAGGGEPRSHKAPAAPATAAGPRAGLGTLDLSDDLIDDLKRFEIEFVEPSSSAESLEDEDFVSLDFGGSPQTGQDSSADAESLDFDIASLYRDEVKSAVQEAPPTTAELENLISFDFGKTPEKNPAAQPEALFEDMLLDFGKPKAEMPSAAPEPAKESEDLPSEKFGFDFDLFEPDTEAATDKGLDFAASPRPETHREEPAATEKRPLGKLGFDLELFEPETTGAAEGGPVMAATPTELSAEAADEDMFADLTDMDQFETKLDLAKAYADMEDDDSAREILLEVITAGNERQKAEATALLDKIGGTAQPEFSLAEPRSGRM